QTEGTLSEIAYRAGFESLSVFHEHFRRFHGLTPTAYRHLPSTDTFTLDLPPDYPLAYLRRALGRDPQSVTERLEGDTFSVVAQMASGNAELQLGASDASNKPSWSSAFPGDSSHSGTVSAKVPRSIPVYLRLHLRPTQVTATWEICDSTDSVASTLLAPAV